MRVDTHGRERAEARQDGQAQLLRLRPSRQQDHRGAIGQLRRIPGRGAAALLEHRLHLGQHLEGGARAGPLILGDHHLLLVAVLVGLGRLDGDDLAVEEALLLRLQRLCVGGLRELVLGLPRDLVLSRHVLRRDAHAQQAGLGHCILLHVGRHLLEVVGASHRIVRHGLNASSQADVDGARPDRLRDRGHGLQPTAALPVDRVHRHLIGQARQEHGHPRPEATGTRLQRVADHAVANLLGVDLGLLDHCLEDLGQEVLRRQLLEALHRLAHRAAQSAADDHVVLARGGA
mmetsp:Transcript_58240/g.138629  ORF Transcript_58240/g.138629 Transcript_58240/m.138629 type:complete len:289 (-) Transcript_58240:143-1009(-)